MTMDNLKMLKEYFGQNLGDFFGHATNRMLLYTFLFCFFLVECSTFWLFYQGPSFILDFMAFTTVYTLHKAAVYTLCIFAADFSVQHMVPSWGAYERRTVGRQWLIWSLGLAAGFVLQRTLVKSLIPVYAPDVIDYFRATRQARLGAVTLLLVLIPYWLVVVSVTLRVVLSKQRIRQLADSLLIIPEGRSSQEISSAAKLESRPVGILKLGGGNGNGAIALADITHVTVEDHYCRVNYATGNGMKSELIRLPLKEMLRKLPGAHFFQIHRSHVVNTGHIARLSKSGRDHKILLQGYDVKLPVSRSRFKDLHPLMKSLGLDK